MSLRIKNTFPVHSVPKDNNLPVVLAPEVFQEAAFPNKKSYYEASTVEQDQDINDRIQETVNCAVNKLLADHAKEIKVINQAHANEMRTMKEEYATEMRAMREEHKQEIKTLRAQFKAENERLERKMNNMQEEFTAYLTLRDNQQQQENQMLASMKSLKTPTSTRKLNPKSRQSSPTKVSVFSSANIH